MEKFFDVVIATALIVGGTCSLAIILVAAYCLGAG